MYNCNAVGALPERSDERWVDRSCRRGAVLENTRRTHRQPAQGRVQTVGPRLRSWEAEKKVPTAIKLEMGRVVKALMARPLKSFFLRLPLQNNIIRNRFYRHLVVP